LRQPDRTQSPYLRGQRGGRGQGILGRWAEVGKPAAEGRGSANAAAGQRACAVISAQLGGRSRAAAGKQNKTKHP
jgi:hypothetical protein